jgi:hypothetical protein
MAASYDGQGTAAELLDYYCLGQGAKTKYFEDEDHIWMELGVR